MRRSPVPCSTEFHPGEDYNVALVSQFANADPAPPDNSTLLRYQVKSMTGSSIIQ